MKELKKKIEISKTKENNSVSKKTEISKKKKEPEYSGFIIIRLTKETNSLKEDDLSELARKNNLKGLIEFFEKFKDIPTRRLIKKILPKEILELETKAKKTKFPPLYSLTSYWRLDARKISNKFDLLKYLNELPEVDLAYLELTVSDPQTVNPADDTHSGTQNYLDAAPTGIDARWAWSQPNSNGAGIGFIDLEQGWFLNHEDLPNPALLYNDNHDGVGTYEGNHGTAVLGIVVGVDNSLGIVGIAPGASPVNVVSHYEAASNTALHVANAILAAINNLNAGDVLLLEVQRNFLPTETDAADMTAIRLAVALGIIVVEAAGNGNTDLDNWLDSSGNDILNRSSANFIDSGAVMVGASVSAVPHNRRWVSNFGSRIDCYAWGEDVVTAGYGDLAPGTGPNSRYTDTFKNTSAASPIIVGAALIIQGMYETATGARFSPVQMRNILSDPATGTPQGTAVAGNIGVMPDLRAIIRKHIPSLRKRIIASSGTMCVNLIEGQQANWMPAVPCWRHPGWYKPNSKDIANGVVWIWSSDWVTQEEAEKGAVRIFCKKFNLKGTGTIVSAEMKVAADNKVLVIINGDIVKEVENLSSLTTFNVKTYLMQETINELKFIVINRGGISHVWPLPTPRTNPAGLIYKLEVTTQK